MKIETKYNVGDEVYSIVFDKDSLQFVTEQITIAEINILKNKTGTFVRYSSRTWGSDSLLEGNLFKTKINCIAECQRRNAGLVHGC